MAIEALFPIFWVRIRASQTKTCLRAQAKVVHDQIENFRRGLKEHDAVRSVAKYYFGVLYWIFKEVQKVQGEFENMKSKKYDEP